jgi:regulator of nucleoside diphosphate kinase
MIDSEAESLSNLAMAVEDRLPQVSEMLLGEITRAVVHAPGHIPADVVTMHAKTTFLDEASGREYTYELVYPKYADIGAGRISILTLVGAGLIGLREGQSILWPDRDGRDRKLTILKVQQQEKAG